MLHGYKVKRFLSWMFSLWSLKPLSEIIYLPHKLQKKCVKSFFHFRSGARWDEGLPEENGLPASEPMYVTSEQSRACQKDKDRRGPAAPEVQEDQARKLRFRFVHIFSMNTLTLHKPHRNIADLYGIGLKSLWALVWVGLGANLADCCITVCFMNYSLASKGSYSSKISLDVATVLWIF